MKHQAVSIIIFCILTFFHTTVYNHLLPSKQRVPGSTANEIPSQKDFQRNLTLLLAIITTFKLLLTLNRGLFLTTLPLKNKDFVYH